MSLYPNWMFTSGQAETILVDSYTVEVVTTEFSVDIDSGEIEVTVLTNEIEVDCG